MVRISTIPAKYCGNYRRAGGEKFGAIPQPRAWRAATRAVRGPATDLLADCPTAHSWNLELDRAAAGKGATERDFVGVFEIAADRQTTRKPAHDQAHGAQ